MNTGTRPMPPTTTMASGLVTSAPMPVASAMGSRPKKLAKQVMNTGRRRSWPDWSSASFQCIPSWRRWLKCESRMIPSITVMPNSARKPIAAGTEKFSPAAPRARMPPTSDSGTMAITSSISRMLPNCT